MSRINIKHPTENKYRCWSTIIDNWISDWLSEEEYKNFLIELAVQDVKDDLEHFGIRTPHSNFGTTAGECEYHIAFHKMCEQCGDFDRCCECEKNIRYKDYVANGNNYLKIEFFGQ